MFDNQDLITANEEYPVMKDGSNRGFPEYWGKRL